MRAEAEFWNNRPQWKRLPPRHKPPSKDDQKKKYDYEKARLDAKYKYEIQLWQLKEDNYWRNQQQLVVVGYVIDLEPTKSKNFHGVSVQPLTNNAVVLKSICRISSTPRIGEYVWYIKAGAILPRKGSSGEGISLKNKLIDGLNSPGIVLPFPDLKEIIPNRFPIPLEHIILTYVDGMQCLGIRTPTHFPKPRRSAAFC